MAGKKLIELEIIVGIVAAVLIGTVIYFASQPVSTISSTIQSTILYTSSSSTVSSTSISQSLGGCPNINYRINNTVTNTTGFETYTISGHTDYVLAQGSAGRISYTTIVTPLAGQTPNILNKSELVAWANQIQYPISNGTLGSAVNSSVSNMSVSFVISQDNLTQNMTQYNVTATIFATVSAPNDTYYITLGPGLPLCGAELALVTIGNAPYNGTIPGTTAA